MTQSINKQIRTIAAIEPESHFVQVGREMLGADLVPASDDAALEQRESGFDGVRRNASTVLISGILFGTVVDGFMFSHDASSFHDVFISAPVVRHQDFYV